MLVVKIGDLILLLSFILCQFISSIGDPERKEEKNKKITRTCRALFEPSIKCLSLAHLILFRTRVELELITDLNICSNLARLILFRTRVKLDLIMSCSIN
jgi:hypothetical protein